MSCSPGGCARALRRYNGAMPKRKLIWNPQQQAVIQAPVESRIFAEGPAGSGKTTAAVERLRFLLAHGVPGDRILILVPQRTLADPYYAALRRADLPAGGLPSVSTVGGLARRMVDLYWPLVAGEAGFGEPNQRPTFLTLETAQYYMTRVVGPLIDREGYFASVPIERNRLYSQLLDNLNKAAVVGFPATEIAERLTGAWVGEQAQTRIFEQAQACAMEFRRYCLAHNLLDFSLQLACFTEVLWPEPLCRDHVLSATTHLIVDNVEEDTPVAHDLIRVWLEHAAAALVLYDADAGYRSFLGASPESAARLRSSCETAVSFSDSFVATPSMATFGGALIRAVGSPARKPTDPAEPGESDLPVGVPLAEALPAVLRYAYHRFYPEMLDWAAEEIEKLVREEEVAPGQIVVLAPFLTDALRFSLSYRLEQRKIPVRSHRPSRALRDEPAAETLLTLAALAHPTWGIVPTTYDVAYMLMQAITELDLVRAQLLAEVLYRTPGGVPTLHPFAEVQPEMQERITFVLGGRYDTLRLWLTDYLSRSPAELDHFLARLFGEILSQPGFGFHDDFDAARVAATLIESIRKFRWIAEPALDGRDGAMGLGQEYLQMVRQGVIAAQYLEPWQKPAEDAVLLAPAYTFLLSNRPVDVQFWLNVGGSGWWERLYQPLTHPYVLSREWPKGKPWHDEDEVAVRQQALQRLVTGLVRRCRQTVYLGLSELGEQGYEQEGALLKAFQRVLRECS